MATVWAARVGVWQDRAYSTGWSHTVQFNGLADLNDQLETANLRGKVTRLGILAHGDRPGIVQLDRPMSLHALSGFQQELERLRWSLTSDAQLIFYSCIAGKSAEGDQFLSALSTMLEGRTIIGFTLYGETGAPLGIVTSPGDVVARESSLTSSGRKLGVLTPEHVAAKWARNGMIVRNSPLERDVQRHCAKRGCPGHLSPRDRCP